MRPSSKIVPGSKVIVTGAAGFLGSHLSEALVSRGAIVIGIDNLFRGREQNVRQLISSGKFELLKIDLSHETSKARIADLVREHRPGKVFHLAAINGTRYFYDAPSEVLVINVSATVNMVSGMVAGGFAGKLVYASSSEVYGEPRKIPTPEDEPVIIRPDQNRDSYALSKAAGEMHVRLNAIRYGWSYCNARIFNCYGPRMDTSAYGQVVPEFIRKATSPAPFEIIGDGSHTRSFCFVTDTVNFLANCAEAVEGDTVNVGSDEEITIIDLARAVHDVVGRPFSPLFLPERPGDHKRRKPDLSKLKLYVPEPPTVSLRDGLKMCVEAYYRDNRS
jgi:nucleoside-diphosphate-sugar epimerase